MVRIKEYVNYELTTKIFGATYFGLKVKK